MSVLTRWIGLACLSIGLVACAVQPKSEPTNESVQTAEPTQQDYATSAPTLNAVTPSTPATHESQPDSTISPEYAALLAKVRSEGTMRVIVTLNVPFQPERQLGSEEAIRQQQAAIAEAQSALIAALEGANSNYRIVDQFETVPQMVLTVDEKGLQTLIASSLVSTISEDSLSAPSP